MASDHNPNENEAQDKQAPELVTTPRYMTSLILNNSISENKMPKYYTHFSMGEKKRYGYVFIFFSTYDLLMNLDSKNYIIR